MAQQVYTARVETLDFSQNARQGEFYNAVIGAVARYQHQTQAEREADEARLRYFFYGGGVRGGKTTVCLALFILLASRFPNSRWHIVRETGTVLEQTTITSFRKFCPPALVKRWANSGSNTHVEFTNGSKIFFFPEMMSGDKDLDRFKGLETNGFMLEQLEELQHATFIKCIERTGSWYIDPMPPPLILATFNPTWGWLKEEIHDKWAEGALKPPFFYMTALAKDNPFVTSEQWSGWRNMDEISYARFIEGDWESRDTTGLFAYSFDTKRHVAEGLEYNPALPLWLSFDFNISPMTCIAAQHTSNTIRVLKEWKVDDIGIEQFLQQHVIPWIPPGAGLRITGDPAGQARQAIAGNTTYYVVIKDLTKVHSQHIVPAPLLSHEASRVQCNSLFSRFPSILVDSRCKYLIQDLTVVKMLPNGQIDKGEKNRMGGNRQQTIGHLLDCMRYYLHKNFPNFVQHQLS